MAFNFNKIKALLVEKGFSARKLAEEIQKLPEKADGKMSESALYKKLNGVNDFTRAEIELICKILKVQSDEIAGYFFDL